VYFKVGKTPVGVIEVDGGFHYKRVGNEWRNTRDDSELFASLSRYASEQGGAEVVLG
jgi:CyaY protein